MDGEMTTTLDELVKAQRREVTERAAQDAAQAEIVRQARAKRAEDGARRWLAERPEFATACGFVAGLVPPAQVKVKAGENPVRLVVTVRGRALLDGREVATTFEIVMHGDTGQWWQRAARLEMDLSDVGRSLEIEEHHDDYTALERVGMLAVLLLEKEAERKARLEREAAEQAAALERGRRGAKVVKRLAQEHLDICRSHDAAVMAWAHEWAALWAPWSGWLVRYAPVGAPAGEGNIQSVLVLDELRDVIRESPGASVRAVDWDGSLHEVVIGAFLDAAPVEFTQVDLHRGMEYHKQVRTYLLDGPAYGEPMVVNVPPGAKWSPPAPPAHPLGWEEYVEERTGRHSVDDPANLVAIDAETLAGWYWVQQFADVEL